MFTRLRIAGLAGAAVLALLLTGARVPAQDQGPEPLPDLPPAAAGRPVPPLNPALPANQAAPEPAPANGIVVQGRGPIHEAYAQPFNKNPEATPVVPKKPPEPIPEEPPAQKPEDANAQWIPGYWAWDVDRKDFIWVSGFWRVPPPGRRWMPGYWTQAANGWRWVPGYWGPADQGGPAADGNYFPTPPPSLDNGPTVPAPDDNSFYIPGCWQYQDTRYLWRPGFWSPGYEGWVWNPAYYAWTPAGCVYVDGYWDYPLANRGLLFAPVSFTQPLWTNPGWVFQPSYVVNCFAGSFWPSLFVGPRWCHYFFGNYYNAAYTGLGLYPWCNYGLAGLGFGRFGYGGFDPLFGYHYWWHHDSLGWVRGVQNTFLARRNGLAAVPANTLAGQVALARAPGGDRLPRTVLPLSQLRHADVALGAVNRSNRAQVRDRIQQYRSFANSRVQTERALAGGQAGRLPRAGVAGAESRRSLYANPGTGGPYRYGRGLPNEAATLRSPGGYAGGRGFQPDYRTFDRAPRTFQAAPHYDFAAPGGGWAHAAPSFQGSAMPSFHAPAPSFQGGAMPSFHETMPSVHGGGAPALHSGGAPAAHASGHH